jgi:mannose-1-phosphate guanylyltransferase
MIIPVILSGGSGSRLWPLSREIYPKQFINLITNNSLFQETILRLPDNLTDPFIVCNEEHRFIVAEQLRQINSSNKGIILEPTAKNTAPAIALSAMHLLREEDDPTLMVLSADHHIEDNGKFSEALKTAIRIAKQDKMVTLGIQPNKAEIGYGYIEVDSSKQDEYYDILSFTEKPSLEIAKKYLKSQKYYWNSGIFIFKASTYLRELKKFEPKIYEICEKSYVDVPKDIDFIRILNKQFNTCPSKSIDYAVMEKTKKGVVVPFDGVWSDIGSWDSIWSFKNKDINNNSKEGDVVLDKVHNSYIHSSNRLIVANDVSDLIIVDTQDALLVSNKNSSQNIKKIVKNLKKDNRKEINSHRKVYRPWGYYDSIDNGEDFQVKRICVNPGAKLSLQKHKKRSEHWVIVKGVALITCGEKQFYLNENESTYIPKEKLHRLENTTESLLEIIEIQTGEYLGEDDIIRIEDDYNRKI